MAIKDIAKIINKRPEMREIAVSEQADMYKHWQLAPYNPDEMISKKGYKIIKTMMTDGHVKGCVNTLKMATLGSGWDIMAASDDNAHIKHKMFVDACLDKFLVGGFYDDLLNILNGLENGWSVSEKVYMLIKHGEWAGKIGLQSIKDKNPEEYKPLTDEFGNLTAIINTGATEDYGKKYDPAKFIVQSFWKKYENIFGETVLRAVYRHWWSKDNIIKFWNIFLNKFGNPTVVAKYPVGASEDDQQKVIDMIKTIQTESGFVVPDDFTVQLLEAVRRGDAGYVTALNFHNAEISKAIFGQTLTAEQGNIGSRALGEVHFDILVFYVNQLQRILEDVVNEQVIKQLIDFNFPDVDAYPYMQMKSIVIEDKHKQVELFNLAVEKGTIRNVTIADENHIRDLLNFEDREQTEREKQEEEESAKVKEEPSEPIDDKAGQPKDDNKDFSEYKKPYRKLTKYEEKVDYEEIFNTLEKDDNKAIDGLAAITRKQVDDIELKIQKRKLLDKGTALREVDKLDLMYLREMRIVMKDSMQDTYKSGDKHGKGEVKKGKQNYAELKLEPLEPKEMLKWFDDKAFIMTGLVRDDMLKTIKMNIYNAKKNGWTLKQTIHGLEKNMQGWLKSGQLQPDKDGVMRAHMPYRIENIVRTNTSEAYNKGRRDAFVAMGDDVPALQYSAILDSRTRPEHAQMDTRIYATNDPIWDIWYPPNGYQCRCLVLPVLKEEEYILSKPISAKPDGGFGAIE